MANAQVNKQMTEAFARAWDFNGIKMIIDNTSMQFATDWANIALKSAVSDPMLRMTIFQEVLAEIKAAKDKQAAAKNPAAAPEQPVPAAPAPQPPAAPKKSSIILTDGD